MDPQRRSPLDAWASKHASIISNASLDILGELPPPLPPKQDPPAGDQSNSSPAPKPVSHHKSLKELPPLPAKLADSPNSTFDFRPPSIYPVQAHKPVISPAHSHTSRKPPPHFDFGSLNDHLSMAVFQLEAGSLEWALFHIEHTRHQSTLAKLLWDVGRHMDWWQDPQPLEFDYLHSVDLAELRNVVGHQPAPRLAVAFSSMAEYGEFFESAAVAMDAPAPSPRVARIGARIGPDMTASSPLSLKSFDRPQTPKLAKSVDYATPALSSPYLSTVSLEARTFPVMATPTCADTPDTSLTVVKPFARTHGRSDSNQSQNSTHMFPYPWRHSRNNSQASFS